MLVVNPLNLEDAKVEQSTTTKIQFTDPGFKVSVNGRNTCCFAGENDELVVSASKDNNLYLWSLPDERKDDQIVSESVATLRGHSGGVYCIHYDHHNSILASAGAEKIIKLWTPITK